MPTKRIPMHKIRDVLRLRHEAKLSHEKIGLALGLSKGVVAKYLSLSQAQGLSWPLPEGMDDAALARQLFPVADKPARLVEPDCPHIHQELKRKGVTLQLLWSEYATAHAEQAYRYSRYCDLYRAWVARQKRSMRQRHLAGEKLFIDYCGPTMGVVDPSTGELRQAQIFVAVLGASSYTYAEATWTQGLADWIASHQRTFRFLGGVPDLLIPDNLRSAVSKPCRYAPQPNDTYQEMARHYGTAILPARPYKPQDKAKAEVGVQVVERWIMARLRHHTFFSLAELNSAIAKLLVELNARPFQKLPGSRQSTFEALDKPALRPLPGEAYDYAEWKQAKAGIDYHIEAARHFYSVPHRLVGQRLDVRLGSALVEVFHHGQRVASHPRQAKGGFTTLPEHMPTHHQQHQQWTPERFSRWADDIGPCTREVVKRQLHERPHPEHGYRACLGLLNLAKRFTRPRLEQACERALALGAPGYRSIHSILQSGLDRQPLNSASNTQGELPLHENVRGPGYYH
ncbi:MAG: IS21 family transposase [Chromatiales bacterium]|nr:IS21 family transposase [Chromatiales bacterium]